MTTPSELACDAARRGDLQSLRQLLDAHSAASILAEHDPNELTTLHWAAASGDPATTQFMLSDDVGADVNAARNNNFTPLHSAAMQGHALICELLIAAGANPNVQTDPQGYAPLHSASWGGHVDAVRVLIQHGANVQLKNYRNETPIETARRQGQDAVVAVIAETKA